MVTAINVTATSPGRGTVKRAIAKAIGATHTQYAAVWSAAFGSSAIGGTSIAGAPVEGVVSGATGVSTAGGSTRSTHKTASGSSTSGATSAWSLPRIISAAGGTSSTYVRSITHHISRAAQGAPALLRSFALSARNLAMSVVPSFAQGSPSHAYDAQSGTLATLGRASGIVRTAATAFVPQLLRSTSKALSATAGTAGTRAIAAFVILAAEASAAVATISRLPTKLLTSAAATTQTIARGISRSFSTFVAMLQLINLGHARTFSAAVEPDSAVVHAGMLNVAFSLAAGAVATLRSTSIRVWTITGGGAATTARAISKALWWQAPGIIYYSHLPSKSLSITTTGTGSFSRAARLKRMLTAAVTPSAAIVRTIGKALRSVVAIVLNFVTDRPGYVDPERVVFVDAADRAISVDACARAVDIEAQDRSVTADEMVRVVYVEPEDREDDVAVVDRTVDV